MTGGTEMASAAAEPVTDISGPIPDGLIGSEKSAGT